MAQYTINIKADRTDNAWGKLVNGGKDSYSYSGYRNREVQAIRLFFLIRSLRAVFLCAEGGVELWDSIRLI